jgi:hypothetical protein
MGQRKTEDWENGSDEMPLLNEHNLRSFLEILE